MEEGRELLQNKNNDRGQKDFDFAILYVLHTFQIGTVRIFLI
jgi:hypothetical protein